MLVRMRRWLRHSLLPMLMMFVSVPIALGDGETFTPVLEITPAAPGIGDPVMLRLSIEVPANLLVNFPRLRTSLGDFAVTGQRALEPDAEAIESREWVQQYRLEPETTGDLVITPLTITVQDPETLKAIEVSTPKTVVHVASIVPPGTDLREIKDILPPVSLPSQGSTFSQWLPLIVGLFVAGCLLFFWRQRKRNMPEELQVQEQAPHRAALDALKALRSETPSDEAAIERFHIRLSDILRRYLDDALTVAAPLKTTEELLADKAMASGPHHDVSGLIGRPLSQCDLVKFARHHPSDEAMLNALEDAVTFVEHSSRQAQSGEDGPHAS